jgi:hypothetical protein
LSTATPIVSAAAPDPEPVIATCDGEATDASLSYALPTGKGFYLFLETVQGPFTREELSEFLRIGKITPDTAICWNHDSNWTPWIPYVRCRQDQP